MLKRHVPPYLLAPAGTPQTAPNINPTTPPEPAPSPAPEPGDEPPPTEDPTPEPGPASGKEDPLLAAVLGDYHDGEKPIEPAPEPGDEPPAPPAAPAAAPAPATPPKKRAKKVIDPTLDNPPPAPPAMPGPVATPAPALPPPPAADPDEAYVASLIDEQKEELFEAEHASRLLPAKYKDRRKQLVDYYKRVDETTQRLTGEHSEDGNYNLSDDPEFKRVLNGKPKIELSDQRKVLRDMGAEEATARVKREVDPEIQAIKFKQAENELQPRLTAISNNFAEAIVDAVEEDEKSPLLPAVKLYKEKGSPDVLKAYPLEAEIMGEEVKHGQTMATEYIKLVNLSKQGFKAYNENNAVHREILDFINSEGDGFAQVGGALLNKNGKSFLPRAQYVGLPPAERDKHWTFTDQDVLGMLLTRTKERVEHRLKTEVERAQRHGFVRSPTAPAAVPPKPNGREPQPIAPPKATTTPAKGPQGNTPAPANPQDISVTGTLYR